MTTYSRNKEKNGLEITFEGIPEESTRDKLKANGFRWHDVGVKRYQTDCFALRAPAILHLSIIVSVIFPFVKSEHFFTEKVMPD